MLNYLCVDLYAESWPKLGRKLMCVDLYVENLAENWPAGGVLGSATGKTPNPGRQIAPASPKAVQKGAVFRPGGGRTAGDALSFSDGDKASFILATTLFVFK